MAGKWMDEGENWAADVLTNKQDLYLGLYKDSSEPAELSSLGDLTEVSGYGYARITLDKDSWTVTDDYATYGQQVFLADGGDWGNIYGYFIATSVDDSGKLLAIEHFSSAKYVEDGKGLKITPKLTIA